MAIGRFLFGVALGLGLAAEGVAQSLPQSLPTKTIGLPCGAGLVKFQPRVIKAAFSLADVRPGQLRIDFAGHSTFLITSPKGVKVATDYNDFHRAKVLPDIATMSGWHLNHRTDNIDPSITHALEDWPAGTPPPRYDVRIKDLRVYSVPANIGRGDRFFRFTTSIFVIESHGVCIAHLGLLAHKLEPETLAGIGRIDVLLTPVEQRVTQSFAEIIANIKGINPKIVVPMHFNAEETVEDFLDQAKAFFPIRRPGTSTLIAQKSTLPKKTEIHFLRPPHFSAGFLR